MTVKIHITDKFYILNERNEIELSDFDTWKEWCQTHNRDIDADELSDGTYIITFFSGVDPTRNTEVPLVFETKVTPRKDEFSDIEVERYGTYDAAVVGHKRMVAKWRKHHRKLPN